MNLPTQALKPKEPPMKPHAIAITLAAAVALPALAQQDATDHAAHHGASAPAAADMTDGEIRKVDKDAAKLTIKHGEIKNLDMPGMTMVFQVKDPKWLDQLKAGDKVRFRVEKAANGLVVTAIEAR
jgi:Cu/Ag efflux protein CusF